MGSLKRKMRRNKEKKAHKEMKKHLNMFGMLGEQCLACAAVFDKKSKEHAKTWRVVVREDKGRVSLYCPECWTKAKELVDQLEEK
tara:strand:- start:556 stop:810 length:255 start_codon:yes stop_codon:yes gene_type:complete